MNRFKAALFDLDGTLVDTESQYSQFWGQIGREFHPELPHFSDTIKGTTLEHIYHSFFPDESLQEAITIRLDEWEAGMDYPFIAGARAFIDNIKNNRILLTLRRLMLSEKKCHDLMNCLKWCLLLKISHVQNPILIAICWLHQGLVVT